MSDDQSDLAFVRTRIADYRAYADEYARHDTDMRVRAYVGERLSAAQTRVASALDPAATQALDATLLRCMFGDQPFLRRLQHADLDDVATAALVASDRALIETADRLSGADAAALPALVAQIGERLDARLPDGRITR